MTEVVLDTSAWIALLEGGPWTAAVEARVGRGAIVVSQLAIAELASLEARRRKGVARPEGRVAVAPLLSEDARTGGALHGRLRTAGNPKVSLIDCLMYATAQRVGAVFVTLDADLRDLPGVAFVAR